MKQGDRVMVFDSLGHPLSHYLYGTVVNDPSANGALVQIDHPGNPAHGSFKYTPAAQILTSEGAKKLAKDARDQALTLADPSRRKALEDQARHHEFISSQLS